MLIRAQNPSLEDLEQTLLTDPVNVGTTTIKVKNTQGFSNTNYMVLGELGTEKCEIVQVNAAVSSDTEMTITAAQYSHSEGDPVTYTRYNQIRFYMATASGGTYSVQTTVDTDVDNASLETVWDDTDGVSTNYYKVSYYNSTTTLESSLSDAIPGSGISTNTVRYITDAILKESKDTEEAITDRDEVLDWLNDCQDDLKRRRRKWSFLYTRAASSRKASVETYSLSTDFGVTNVDVIDHIDHNYIVSSTDNNTYRLRYIPKEEFDYQTESNTASESDSTEVWTWDESVDYIRVYPIADTTQTSAFYMYYYKNFTALDSDGDTLEIPDTRIYKYYALQQFYIKKEDLKRSDYYGAKYEQALSNLARKERKEIGQPYGFRYVPKGIRRFYKY